MENFKKERVTDKKELNIKTAGYPTIQSYRVLSDCFEKIKVKFSSKIQRFLKVFRKS